MKKCLSLLLLLPIYSVAQSNFSFEYLNSKGVVSQKGGVYHINLSFDLHGPDCGAPDCYETQLRLEFNPQTRIGDSIPANLIEIGCVEQSKEVELSFTLQHHSTQSIFLTDLSNHYLLVFQYISSIEAALLYDSERIGEVTPSNFKTYLASEGELYPYQSTSLRE